MLKMFTQVVFVIGCANYVAKRSTTDFCIYIYCQTKLKENHQTLSTRIWFENDSVFVVYRMFHVDVAITIRCLLLASYQGSFS